jgi:PAS domain S-box-containing protein
MSRFNAWLNELPYRSPVIRYVLAVVSVCFALLLTSALQRCSVRDPFVLIYLAALSVSLWCGGKGPGILAFLLSTACLLLSFRLSERHWLHVALYDLPTLCLFGLFAWWIQMFAGSRHHMERALRQNGEELEAAVKERTIEMFRVNAEYKTILDAAPFGIALFGRERLVERCNPEYEKVLGYGPGELLGKRAPLPEDQRAAWGELEVRLRSGQSVADLQVPRLRRDGSRFCASIWLTPLHDCRGEYAGMVGFILDSTERNAREADRQMLATLVECSPDLVAVTDRSGKLAFINSAGRSLLGVDRDVSLTQIDLARQFHHEHQGGTGMVHDSLLLESGSFDMETTYKDLGSAKDIQLHCTSFTIPSAKPGGSSLRAFVAQNISERKEAEEKLKASLEENRRLLEENKLLQERLRHENISLQERNQALQSEIADIQRAGFEKIIGESPAIHRALSKIGQVAATDVTVLITGETGSGKELIAQAIHENSKRAGMPFRAINCAALPSSLMAAELFGHEKGAFTGADRLRLGQFEMANGGTLFLDEIAKSRWRPKRCFFGFWRSVASRGLAERNGYNRTYGSSQRLTGI